MSRSPLGQWIAMLCVPCVALAVVARQVYLSRCYGLSTWKGGGMGMFASADQLANRYAKIFLIDADGNRNPLVQLTPADNDVLNRALEYPTRENFLRAARQIASENWIPSFQPRPLLKVNSNGDPVSASEKSYRQMVPSALPPEGIKKPPTMEVQYWKIMYDPHTRVERGSLAETYLFRPEDLFRRIGTQNNG